MATRADVRRIALSFPQVEESPDYFAFSVPNKGKMKGIAWVWLERLEPKKARVPNPKVLAVRVANLAQKDLILAADSRKFFTEPHYNGYPAVLVRLAEVTSADLRMLIGDAWHSQASSQLRKAMGEDGSDVAKRVTAKRAKKSASTAKRSAPRQKRA